MNTFAIVTLALFAALGWLCAYLLLCDCADLQAKLDAHARRLNAQEAQRQVRQVEWVVADD